MMRYVFIFVVGYLAVVLSFGFPLSAFALTDSAAPVRASSQGFLASPSASVDPSGDISYEAWINPASVSEFQAVFDNLDSGTGFGYGMFVDDGGVGHVFCQLDSSYGSIPELESASTISTGVWTHVACTYNESTLEILINGVEDASEAVGDSYPVGASTGDLGIGMRGNYTGGHFDGEISDPRVWSVGRTDSQIYDNYCTVFGAPETDLLGEWSLDNVLTDSSGNGNTLANQNSTGFNADVPSCLSGGPPPPPPPPPPVYLPSTLDASSQSFVFVWYLLLVASFFIVVVPVGLICYWFLRGVFGIMRSWYE